jgi:hypothetical protein
MPPAITQLEDEETPSRLLFKLALARSGEAESLFDPRNHFVTGLRFHQRKTSKAHAIIAKGDAGFEGEFPLPGLSLRGIQSTGPSSAHTHRGRTICLATLICPRSYQGIHPIERKKRKRTLLSVAKRDPTQRMPVEAVTCILKFPDGEKVSGKVRQASRQDRSPITYAGDIKRLGLAYEAGTVQELKNLFELVARATGATLIVFSDR